MLDSPRLFPCLPRMDRALTIASPARVGDSDGLDVALAEQEGWELHTADDRLVRTLPPSFLFITPLAALP
jgi:predicted nucleic acid-binding protein